MPRIKREKTHVDYLLAKRIKTLRERMNISQQLLAEYFNISQSIITHYECARRKPSIDMRQNYMRLAKKLGVEVRRDYLYPDIVDWLYHERPGDEDGPGFISDV